MLVPTQFLTPVPERCRQKQGQHRDHHRQNPNRSSTLGVSLANFIFLGFYKFYFPRIKPRLANHGFMDASVQAMPPPPRTGQ
jgi:hypothetical protein